MTIKKFHLTKIIETLENAKNSSTPEQKLICHLIQEIIKYRISYDETTELIEAIENKLSELELRLSILELNIKDGLN